LKKRRGKGTEGEKKIKRKKKKKEEDKREGVCWDFNRRKGIRGMKKK